MGKATSPLSLLPPRVAWQRVAAKGGSGHGVPEEGWPDMPEDWRREQQAKEK